MGSYSYQPAPRHAHASCYDPESGSSEDTITSKLAILLGFFHELGLQIWAALLPILFIISAKFEELWNSARFILPTSTHSVMHSQHKDKSWQAKVKSVLSRERLQQLQRSVVATAQEVSEVVSKTGQQFVHHRRPIQARPADMV